MASEQLFAGDLRSEARESNRDKTSRVKWAHGAVYGPGRRAEDNHVRPASAVNVHKPSVDVVHRAGPSSRKGRTALKNDITYASGDSSADEEIEHPSAAPVPDAGVAYSFDAERGPNQGSQILGLALAKAIERYEVRETDKLIKNEYEVLRLDEEMLSPGPKTSRKGVAPEDEDYEFIEA